MATAALPLPRCTHCRGDLTKTMDGLHCAGSKTCTWIKCTCGATIDRALGNHTHPSHEGPPSEWRCKR